MQDYTIFLTFEEVTGLHEKVINRFGGSHGFRDPGSLDSALARPRSGYYASLSQQAAALLQSLAMNHAFVDGNKRVAWAATEIFLLLNGSRLTCNNAEAEAFLLREVIEGHLDIYDIAKRLETWMRPV